MKGVVPDLLWSKVKEHKVARTSLPKRADVVVTTSGLNLEIERFAAKLSASVVVLPEAYEWLQKRVTIAVETATPFTLVDASVRGVWLT